MSSLELFSMKMNRKRRSCDVGVKMKSHDNNRIFLTEAKPLSKETRKREDKSRKNRTLDVYLNIDCSLKGWTENSVFPRNKEKCGNLSVDSSSRASTGKSVFPKNMEKHLNSNRNNVNSIYCDVLTDGNCHECRSTERKLSNINSSLARFPDLETGGYRLFQSLSEKQKIPERTSYSALSFVSVPSVMDNGYSSSESSSSLQRRVRAASAVLSDLNREASGSGRLNSQARPFTSRTARVEDSLQPHARASSSRASARRVSPMSQEGWSKKQIEAWKLLAPTPPQIEVSQMNVSMYTPKELPGIKIFDESLFVI